MGTVFPDLSANGTIYLISCRMCMCHNLKWLDSLKICSHSFGRLSSTVKHLLVGLFSQTVTNKNPTMKRNPAPSLQTHTLQE